MNPSTASNRLKALKAITNTLIPVLILSPRPRSESLDPTHLSHKALCQCTEILYLQGGRAFAG